MSVLKFQVAFSHLLLLAVSGSGLPANIGDRGGNTDAKAAPDLHPFSSHDQAHSKMHGYLRNFIDIRGDSADEDWKYAIQKSNAVKTLEQCESDDVVVPDPLDLTSDCRVEYAAEVTLAVEVLRNKHDGVAPVMQPMCRARYYIHVSNAIKTLEGCENSFILDVDLTKGLCRHSYRDAVREAYTKVASCEEGATRELPQSPCRSAYLVAMNDAVGYKAGAGAANGDAVFILKTSNAIKELEKCEQDFILKELIVEEQVTCNSDGDCRAANCGIKSLCGKKEIRNKCFIHMDAAPCMIRA